jgi:hypothetical protein
MQKPWFRAKKYGWGWGLPLTWQGWVVFAGYFAFIVYDAFRLDINSSSDVAVTYAFDSIVASIVLVVIAYLTGEKPRWRWGDSSQ